MNSTQTTEQNVNRDEHQDELSSTETSNLNNSVEYLGPKELNSEFSKNIEHFNRKLSAPNPQILRLTLSQMSAGNRLRCSYINRLMCKGLLAKC